MSEPNRLIDALVDDLAPVKPVARLRLHLLSLLGVGTVFALAALAWKGLRPGLAPAVSAFGGYTWLVASLGGGVVLALLGGLALMRPGREQLGAASAWTGVVALASSAALLVFGASGADLSATARFDMLCLQQATLLGLLPCVGLLAFASRGWPSQTRLATASLALAAGALGGLVTHLACSLETAVHLAVGHGASPWLLAALFTLPAERWLRSRQG